MVLLNTFGHIVLREPAPEIICLRGWCFPSHLRICHASKKKASDKESYPLTRTRIGCFVSCLIRSKHTLSPFFISENCLSAETCAVTNDQNHQSARAHAPAGCLCWDFSRWLSSFEMQWSMIQSISALWSETGVLINVSVQKTSILMHFPRDCGFPGKRRSFSRYGSASADRFYRTVFSDGKWLSSLNCFQTCSIQWRIVVLCWSISLQLFWNQIVDIPARKGGAQFLSRNDSPESCWRRPLLSLEEFPFKVRWLWISNFYGRDNILMLSMPFSVWRKRNSRFLFQSKIILPLFHRFLSSVMAVPLPEPNLLAQERLLSLES